MYNNFPSLVSALDHSSGIYGPKVWTKHFLFRAEGLLSPLTQMS